VAQVLEYLPSKPQYYKKNSYNNPKAKYHYYTYFTVEKIKAQVTCSKIQHFALCESKFKSKFSGSNAYATEAQRGWVTCLKSHSQEFVRPEWKFRNVFPPIRMCGPCS
jgi:hypothetical protein